MVILMKLYTDRLVLRRFEEYDLAAFFELARDRETNRFLPFFPPETEAVAAVLLHERFLTETGAPADCCYAVCLRADERPIGYVTLMGDAHDLGYALRSDYWGRGIAAEAAAALAVLGYTQQDIAVAMKGVDVENLPLEEIVRQSLKKMVK